MKRTFAKPCFKVKEGVKFFFVYFRSITWINFDVACGVTWTTVLERTVNSEFQVKLEVKLRLQCMVIYNDTILMVYLIIMLTCNCSWIWLRVIWRFTWFEGATCTLIAVLFHPELKAHERWYWKYSWMHTFIIWMHLFLHVHFEVQLVRYLRAYELV